MYLGLTYSKLTLNIIGATTSCTFSIEKEDRMFLNRLERSHHLQRSLNSGNKTERDSQSLFKSKCSGEAEQKLWLTSLLWQTNMMLLDKWNHPKTNLKTSSLWGAQLFKLLRHLKTSAADRPANFISCSSNKCRVMLGMSGVFFTARLQTWEFFSH